MSQLRIDRFSSDCLTFNRRRSPRWSVEGSAVAIRTGGDRFGLVHRLEAVDCSTGGMGARTDAPIEVGTPILVGFESPLERHRAGTVMRCEVDGEGYRIALRFDVRIAA